MRIIGGEFRGRILQRPRCSDVRPTKDNIRQTLFDVLAGSVRGCRVIDLFAGSGSLGLEALSRGAGAVLFVEKEAGCLMVLKENVRALGPGVSSRATLIKKDVLRFLKGLGAKDACALRSADIVLLDPPYGLGLGQKALKLLDGHAIVDRNFVVVWEHHKKDDLPEGLHRLALVQRKEHGDTVLSFYRSAA